MDTDIPLSISNQYKTLLEFRRNGDVYYNFNDELKKVEDRDDILDAFKSCVIGLTTEDSKVALFNKFLERIDNDELTIEQIIKIEKRIRKIKLKKLENTINR